MNTAEEFRTALYLQFAISPPNLPTECGGIPLEGNYCNQKFSVDHAFYCKYGGKKSSVLSVITTRGTP